MRVLVLSDKYPPYVDGGAEISLHRQIQRLKDDCEVTVAAMCPDAPSSWRQDGVEVSNLPALPTYWPPTLDHLLSQRLPLPGGVRARLKWPEAALRYMLSGHAASRSEAAARLRLFRRLARAQAGDWIPSFEDDQLTASITPQRVSDMIAEIRPDLIHADNHRSIIIAARADTRGVPLLALVRDNRFLCAQRDQRAYVGAAACETCDTSCVTLDCPAPGEDLRAAMRNVAESRLEALRRADRIVTTSRFLARQITRLAPGSGTHVSIAPNPCDPPEEVDAYQAGIARAEPPEILVVGMINPNKGQAAAPRWAQALEQRVNDFRIVLAGRGRMAARIEEAFAALGLRDHLILTGFLDRAAIYRAYARASVVLAPNIWPEPFGRTPLEAGLSRRPIVAYDVGGIGESIRHGETGFLAAPGDEVALIDHVATLIEDPRTAKRMGESARAHILSAYAPSTTCAALLEAWRETAARR